MIALYIFLAMRKLCYTSTQCVKMRNNKIVSFNVCNVICQVVCQTNIMGK